MASPSVRARLRSEEDAEDAVPYYPLRHRVDHNPVLLAFLRRCESALLDVCCHG
jgi:hypothetical protein